MCFTPAISLTTFAIEMILAALVIWQNPKKRFNQVSALIILLLGLYQLMEFMVCTSADTLFWGRMAHIAYTFLPALGVTWALILAGSKRKMHFIYAFPTVFVALALFTPEFVQAAECSRFFIRIIYGWSPLWFWSYILYYSLFIFAAGAILMKSIAEQSNKKLRKAQVWGLIGLLSFTFPTFLFLLAFPAMGIMFPSILCEFAVLFALAVFIAARQNRLS